MEAEDVFILQKIIAAEGFNWTPEFLSHELDYTVPEIERFLVKLRKFELLSSSNKLHVQNVKKFLLQELPKLFPAKPGSLGRGTLTGAKPGHYFCVGLPYTSIWIWPHEDGQDVGYEISPLSPKCCFAVLQDEKLKKILAITETLRVAGSEARSWAEQSFKQIGLF